MLIYIHGIDMILSSTEFSDDWILRLLVHSNTANEWPMEANRVTLGDLIYKRAPSPWPINIKMGIY